MATFKEIRGFKIKSLATDPSPLEEGQIWYNSTSGTLKVAPFGSASWASGGNLINSRKEIAVQGGGIQTAALAIGGSVPAKIASTEEYDGSSWTAGVDYPQPITQLASFGTQTAMAAFCGEAGPGIVSSNAEYNGTAWTSATAYPAALKRPVGGGILSAGIGAGGAAPTVTDASNEYDGTNWTAGGTMNTARSGAMGGGPQTATLIAGSATEEYNGTGWATNPANLNTPRSSKAGTGGADAQTACLIAGGGPPGALAETFDGSTWTASTAMSTGRVDLGGCGTESAGLVYGGEPGAGTTNATEEYTGAAVAAKTITTS
jgi:hypothetical protein